MGFAQSRLPAREERQGNLAGRAPYAFACFDPFRCNVADPSLDSTLTAMAFILERRENQRSSVPVFDCIQLSGPLDQAPRGAIDEGIFVVARVERRTSWASERAAVRVSREGAVATAAESRRGSLLPVGGSAN